MKQLKRVIIEAIYAALLFTCACFACALVFTQLF